MKHLTFVKEYLVFSKKERIAVIIVLICIIIVAFLPLIKTGAAPKAEATDTSWLTAADYLQQKSPENNFHNSMHGDNLPSNEPQNTYNSKPDGRLFYFDPNTLNAEGFKKLGLRDKTIKTLLHYRNKGGRFRKPEDIAKIYGLRPEEFKRLKPFVQIQATNHPPATYAPHNTSQAAYVKTPVSKRAYRSIEINGADTSAFKSLYGIGSKLAARIVHYRNKLGGFYAIEQVGETYGIPDSTWQQIKPYLQINTAAVRKININTATYDELNNHPYISSRLAFLILKLRKEKGSFSAISDIKDLFAQTKDSFGKVSKYIIAD